MQQLCNSIPSLTLLVAICDRVKGRKITGFFNDRGPSFSVMTLGKGTAGSRILNYLGLGETEKVVVFSILPTSEVRDVVEKMDEALDMKRPGHGIAFTLPMDRACAKGTVKTISDSEEDGGSKVEHTYKHELILAVVNRGYNQDVMDAARQAQATGGTIIHAKGFALDGAAKFFGVTLQPEKELVLILAPSERRDDIMQAIAQKAGLRTPAGTVTFSLPVSSVVGLQSSLSLGEENE